MACQAQTTPAFSGAGMGSARDGPRRSLRGQRFLLGTAAAFFLVALFPAALDAPRVRGRRRSSLRRSRAYPRARPDRGRKDARDLPFVCLRSARESRWPDRQRVLSAIGL